MSALEWRSSKSGHPAMLALFSGMHPCRPLKRYLRMLESRHGPSPPGKAKVVRKRLPVDFSFYVCSHIRMVRIGENAAISPTNRPFLRTTGPVDGLATANSHRRGNAVADMAFNSGSYMVASMVGMNTTSGSVTTRLFCGSAPPAQASVKARPMSCFGLVTSFLVPTYHPSRRGDCYGEDVSFSGRQWRYGSGRT